MEKFGFYGFFERVLLKIEYSELKSCLCDNLFSGRGTFRVPTSGAYE